VFHAAMQTINVQIPGINWNSAGSPAVELIAIQEDTITLSARLYPLLLEARSDSQMRGRGICAGSFRVSLPHL